MKKKLWFKAKDYGWGWYPITWQGWFTLILYTVYLIFGTTPTLPVYYMIEVLSSTTILILICFLTGEKPEWRWGKNKPTRSKKV